MQMGMGKMEELTNTFTYNWIKFETKTPCILISRTPDEEGMGKKFLELTRPTWLGEYL